MLARKAIQTSSLTCTRAIRSRGTLTARTGRTTRSRSRRPAPRCSTEGGYADRWASLAARQPCLPPTPEPMLPMHPSGLEPPPAMPRPEARVRRTAAPTRRATAPGLPVSDASERPKATLASSRNGRAASARLAAGRAPAFDCGRLEAEVSDRRFVPRDTPAMERELNFVPPGAALLLLGELTP
jgi:hypothetical protein